MNIILNDKVAEIAAERGIKEEDIKIVLEIAVSGNKMRLEDNSRFVAKKRIGEFTTYVEYAQTDNNFDILNVYGHRISLKEDN